MMVGLQNLVTFIFNPCELTPIDGKVFCDSPGYKDTKGVHQEILNSYCNARMIRVGCRAKILLVVEVSSLKSARGGNFVELAQLLAKLFQNDFRQIIYSSFLVITKVQY